MTSSEATLRSFGYEQELKRSLSLADLMIYGLVFMVPIAPFAIFGVVFNSAKGMVPLTYVIGLVAMLFTALSYREMSRAFPIAGSVYSYAGRGINDKVGFMAGWAILLDYLLVPTLLYVVSAAALTSLVPGVPQWLWVVGFVVVNTVINYLGIESTARLNRLFLFGELVVLALFVVFGIAAIVAHKNGAFYDVARIASGAWLKTTVAVASALAAGIANSMVAQAATSRLLYSMARDRKLPAFLAHVHPVRKIPERAILFVSVLSLILGLTFVGQVDLRAELSLED
jgi:amino acid transporter